MALGLVAKRHPRHINVRPGVCVITVFFDKAFEEIGAGSDTTGAPARIFDLGKVAANFFAVFGIEWC